MRRQLSNLGDDLLRLAARPGVDDYDAIASQLHGDVRAVTRDHVEVGAQLNDLEGVRVGRRCLLLRDQIHTARNEPRQQREERGEKCT